MNDRGASPKLKKHLQVMSAELEIKDHTKKLESGEHTCYCQACPRASFPRPSVPQANVSHSCGALYSRLSILDFAAEMPALQKDFHGLSALSLCVTNSSSARPCWTKRRSSWGLRNRIGKRFSIIKEPWCMTTVRSIPWLNEAPRWPTVACGVGSRGWAD